MTDFLGVYHRGCIEVICGCMYSGKSEELIRQLRRADLARQNFQVFKPSIDNRYSKSNVHSHNDNCFPSTVVENSEQILSFIKRDTNIVGIDEGQFFDPNITEVALTLAETGCRVIIAGLDTDWRGRPFGPMPELLAVAEIVRKQYAICRVCGEPATRTQRLVADQQDILVGSHGAYEARCRSHFDPLESIKPYKRSHNGRPEVKHSHHRRADRPKSSGNRRKPDGQIQK